MLETLSQAFLSKNDPSFYDIKAKSTQELLANFHAKLNECVKEINTFTESLDKQMDDFLVADEKSKQEHMTAIRQEYQDFINIIDLRVMELENYARTELNSSIIDFLRNLETSGIITDELRKLYSNILNDVSTLDSRMNTFTSLAEGSTTGDAELMDVRVGVDGTVYESAGDAVRAQISTSNTMRDIIYNGDIELTNFYYNLTTGVPVYTESGFWSSEILPLKIEDIILTGVMTATHYLSLFKNGSYVGYLSLYPYEFKNTTGEVVDNIEYDSFAICLFLIKDDIKIHIKNVTDNSDKIDNLTPLKFEFVSGSLFNLKNGDFNDNTSWKRTEILIGSELPVIYSVTDKDIYACVFDNARYLGYYNYTTKQWFNDNTEEIEKPVFNSYLLEFNDIVLEIEPIVKCHWNNKKVGLKGDSITVGTYKPVDGSTSKTTRSYPYRTCEKLGMNVTNYASNGISISGTSNVNSSGAIVNTYNNMADDLDMVIITGGTNDYGTNVDIGRKEDTTDVSFYGALYVLMNGLIEKYPDKTIIFVTPVNRVNEDNKNTVGHTLDEYREAIKTRCKQFGIKCVDGTELGVHCANPTYASQNVVDGTHLNPSAHITASEKLANILRYI